MLVLLVLLTAALPAVASPYGEVELATLETIRPDTLDPTPVWSSDEEEPTQSVAWGDYDGDGDLDLAVGNGYLAGAPNRIYRNEGGTLALAWVSVEKDNTASVAWGDWDNDGDLDLAVGNLGEPNRVYENDGGYMNLAWSSGQNESTHSLAWGDYDDDGDLDLALGNSGFAMSNQVYENQGGVLVLNWSSVEEEDTNSVAWGDYDNDGDLDLAVGNNSAPNQVYENEGGSLSLAWTSSDSLNTQDVAWGDYNGDGYLDLAAVNWSGGSRIYGSPGGSGSSSANLPDDGFATSVAWGDYDNDGDLDLAVGHAGAPIQVWSYDWVFFVRAWSSGEEDDIGSLAWGDWDGDGDLDLAAGNVGDFSDSAANRVYENLGLPMYTKANWSSDEDESTASAAWGDFDGDGDLDLAVGNDGAPVQVYENRDLHLVWYWASAEICETKSVAWGDYDGDGDLDLAVGNYEQADQLYRNQGGSLTLAWTSAEISPTYSLAWGDVDGDGDLDLAVGNENQSNLLYRNTGGSLTLQWSSAERSRTLDLAWGDWDNDTDLDLAVGNSLEPNLVYENDGAGELTLAWSSTELDQTTSVAWGDVDGDGDLDLAAGNGWYAPQSNRIYLNDGAGLEGSAAWSSAESDTTWSLAWGDWDSDGDLDLAAGNYDAEPNRVYQNLESALDAMAVWSTEEADHTASLAWGDWDLDGDIDLLSGNMANQANRLYLNNRVPPNNYPNNAAYAVVHTPDGTDDAYFYASPEVQTSAQVPIWFHLYDAEGDPVQWVRPYFSPNCGGLWLPATVSGRTHDLSTSPDGSLHLLLWDAFADGARGDNVLFRLVSGPDVPTWTSPPIQHPYTTSDSRPFRLRPLAVSLWPPRQLGIGTAGEVLTHTLTLYNRTGRDGIFAVTYDSFRGWPVDGPSLVAIPDLQSTSMTISTTIPSGLPGVLDAVTVTAGASFNPVDFQGQAYVFTYRGTPAVDLSLFKEAPVTVEAATVMTYTLVAHNAGSSPASGVEITDVLPTGVEFDWASDDGTYSSTLGAVLWPEMLLFAGQSVTVTVAVTVGCAPSGTLIVNDIYDVDCDQCAQPAMGPPVETTVHYQAPVAAFSLDPTEINLGDALVTSNSSQHATGYLWGFGDGITSTLAEPQHVYTAEGIYDVTLLAYNACGGDLATVQVTATLFLKAGFDRNAPACLGEAVVFTNTTSGFLPISYLWSLGDGMTTTVEHPNHLYADAGIYPVVLLATNDYASDAAAGLVIVLPVPAAAFSYTVDELTVSFTNTSIGANSCLWDFGDGDTDTARHPTHTYAFAGSYTVTLAVSGACGLDETVALVTVRGAGYSIYLPVVVKAYQP
jgi:uncharacterized repeat protein (TIGR01451 family)